LALFNDSHAIGVCFDKLVRDFAISRFVHVFCAARPRFCVTTRFTHCVLLSGAFGSPRMGKLGPQFPNGLLQSWLFRAASVCSSMAIVLHLGRIWQIKALPSWGMPDQLPFRLVSSRLVSSSSIGSFGSSCLTAWPDGICEKRSYRRYSYLVSSLAVSCLVSSRRWLSLPRLLAVLCLAPCCVACQLVLLG